MTDPTSPKNEPRIISWLTNVKVQVVFAFLTLCIVLFYNVIYYPLEIFDGTDLVEADYAVLVTRVYPGGPADQAGILPGDEIVSIDGRHLSGLIPGPPYKLSLRPGDAVAYEVRRGQEILHFTVTVQNT